MPPKWYNDRFSHVVIFIVWIVSIGTASMSMIVSVVIAHDDSTSYFGGIWNDADEATQLNKTNYLCVASFTPEMTLISTFLSFILPGVTLLFTNIGKLV